MNLRGIILIIIYVKSIIYTASYNVASPHVKSQNEIQMNGFV